MDSIKEKSKFLDSLTVEERAVDAKGNTTKRDDFYEKLGRILSTKSILATDLDPELGTWSSSILRLQIIRKRD